MIQMICVIWLVSILVSALCFFMSKGDDAIGIFTIALLSAGLFVTIVVACIIAFGEADYFVSYVESML